MSTTWTPLTELGPDCSALALFHRDFEDVEELTKLGLAIEQIQEFDEPKENKTERKENLLAGYRTFLEKCVRSIRVPMPEIGDVILFSSRVLHGTQVSPDAPGSD